MLQSVWAVGLESYIDPDLEMEYKSKSQLRLLYAALPEPSDPI